jgi:hypothetical protein
MMLMYEPAAPMLKFFQEIGVPMPDRTTIPPAHEQPDRDTIMSILVKYLEIIEAPP